jgi:colicin import membrane protein
MVEAVFKEKMPLIKRDVEGILAEVAAVSVRNEEELTLAATLRNKIRMREKRIDEVRKELIRPYQDQVKAYNAAFQGEGDRLESARRIVDEKIEAYMHVQELRAMEEQRKAEEAKRAAEKEAAEKAEALRKQAAEAKSVEEKEHLEEKAKETVYEAQLQHLPAEQAKSNVRTEAGTLTRKKVWTYEIYNPEEFVVKFPHLCMPDPKKVLEHVRNEQREFEGNGLKIFQATQFSSR